MRTRLSEELTNTLREVRDAEFGRPPGEVDHQLVQTLDNLIRGYGTAGECAASKDVAGVTLRCANGFGHLGAHSANSEGISLWWEEPK